ncbi:hypothetical protein D3C87_958430 [compost metagenome]
MLLGTSGSSPPLRASAGSSASISMPSGSQARRAEVRLPKNSVSSRRAAKLLVPSSEPKRFTTTCSGRMPTVACEPTLRLPGAQNSSLSRTRTLPSASTVAGSMFMRPTKPATKRVRGLRYSSSGVPACSMRPLCISTTRSAIERASSWSCVTMMVTMPRRFCSARISLRSVARTCASSAESGSSSSSRRGLGARARASAMRCCWPPESCTGYLSACAVRPTRSSISRERLAISRARAPVGCRP